MGSLVYDGYRSLGVKDCVECYIGVGGGGAVGRLAGRMRDERADEKIKKINFRG